MTIEPPSPKKSSSGTASHFLWIDMLRGLAALGVVLFHVRVDLWVGWVQIHQPGSPYSWFDRLASCLAVPFVLGGSGVMLFFLLSGFCVHYPQAGQAGRFPLGAYAVRRFFRIVPPYLAAVVFTALVEWIVSRYFGQTASPPRKLAETFLMIQNYGQPPGQLIGNPSLWSLPVEMELYAVYLLFIVVLWQFGMRVSMMLAGLVSLATTGLLLSGREWLMANFATYWLIWCAGALLAEWQKRGALPEWKKGYGLLTAVLFAMAVAGHKQAPVAAQNYLWAGFYFMVIWWGLARSARIQNWHPMLLRRLSVLGLISYSLYLIHFPFFKLCGAAWQAWQGSKPVNFLIPLAFCPLVVLLAYGFYRAFEAPSHAWARKLARSK